MNERITLKVENV